MLGIGRGTTRVDSLIELCTLENILHESNFARNLRNGPNIMKDWEHVLLQWSRSLPPPPSHLLP